MAEKNLAGYIIIISLILIRKITLFLGFRNQSFVCVCVCVYIMSVFGGTASIKNLEEENSGKDGYELLSLKNIKK